MKEKIEWYQEVLELEPSSRVFFPLARLLAENGRCADAASVLRQGLDRHPEHFEARMLFLEMLVQTNREEEAGELALGIARIISEYPSFWRKWAQELSAGESGMESSLAVSFLAARFNGNPISWGEVIRLGLSAVTGESVAGERQLAPERTSASPADDSSEEQEDDSELPEFIFDTPEGESAGFFGSEQEAAVLVSEESATDEAGELSGLSPGFEEDGPEEDSGEDEEGEGEETFSLRTMTMAGLLAGQGDCRGALDIYKELVEGELSAPRRERLEGLIAEMESRLAEAASPEQGKAAEGKGQSGQEAVEPDVVTGLKGKKKLMSTLEELASRLEERASGQD